MTKHIFYLIIFLFSVQISFSQKIVDENIGTEVVNVVKLYKPSVSDAFKVQEKPEIMDDIDLKKKELSYTIFSAPVASTFTPSKGKAAFLDKQAPKKLYNNYASLAIGNYLNVLAEFYAALPMNSTDSFIIGLNHHSAQGEIKEVQLDDKFYDTDLNLTFSKRDRDISYQISGLFKHQQYNWYGTSYSLTDLQRANINASHTYLTGGLRGNIQIDNSYFKGGFLSFDRFWDTNEAVENSILITPEFEFEILDADINFKTTIDYVSGFFGIISPEFQYSYLKTGVQPSYQFTQNDLNINIGAEFVFGIDTENKKSDIYVYPKLNASYNLINNSVIAFGGVDGGLAQNSYKGFAEENKFLAPSLLIAPTHKQFDAFLGLKGNVTNLLSYEIKGSFLNEENKSMYLMNPVNDVNLQTDNYKKVNTFGVVYDNVNTLQLEGNLTVNMSNKYSIGISGVYTNYKTDIQAHAWNLPELKASLFSEFLIYEKWSGGVKVFYEGDRKDNLSSSTSIITESIITLEGFFDANAYINYNVTQRFTAFLKVNNIASQGYQKWQSYPIQQIQILGGLKYKFDF